MPILILRPTSDYSIQWGYYQGSPYHYRNIDEVVTDDSDYNYMHGNHNAVFYDHFGFPNPSLPNNAVDIVVRMYWRAKKNPECVENDVFTWPTVIIDGADYSSYGSHVLTDSFVTHSEEWPHNLKSLSDWTPDNLNRIGTNVLQYFGIGFINFGATQYDPPFNTAYCSQLYMEISYETVSSPGSSVWVF